MRKGYLQHVKLGSLECSNLQVRRDIKSVDVLCLKPTPQVFRDGNRCSVFLKKIPLVSTKVREYTWDSSLKCREKNSRGHMKLPWLDRVIITVILQDTIIYEQEGFWTEDSRELKMTDVQNGDIRCLVVTGKMVISVLVVTTI